MFSLESLIRPHILKLKPYTSAKDEYEGSEGVFLDANENPIGSATAEPFNRYPDPYQRLVKAKLAHIKHCLPEQVFMGNGSDEPIDLLYRAFCNPHHDNVVITPPTYGMYEVSGEINAIELRKANLTPQFELDADLVLSQVDDRTKLIFLCSPNNPTGNLLNSQAVEKILRHFKGLVVIDEAYIDFAPQATWLKRLNEFANLVVLQTFSKAWGLAALRLGLAFASPAIIKILNKIKSPYNVNILSQQYALQALDHEARKNQMVNEMLQLREELIQDLQAIACVKQVYPTDANFILIKVTDANAIYKYLIDRQVIVRNRSTATHCENCLRVSVGTIEENHILVKYLRGWQ